MDWDAAIRMIAVVAQNTAVHSPAQITLGYACNNRCLACGAEDWWKSRLGDRDTLTVLNELERIVNDCAVDKLVYTGGEPTVRNDLPTLFRHARELGVTDQNLHTNARRFRDLTYLGSLQEAGLGSCFVTIHGAESAVHDELTQVRGSFDQTCEGLTNLDRLGIDFVTHTLVCKQNYRSLGKLISLLGSSFPSISYAKLSYPELQGRAKQNMHSTIEPLWEVAPFIREAIEEGHRAGVHVVTGSVPICLLGPHFDRADELVVSKLHISDLSGSPSDHNSQDKYDDHVCYDVCEDCEVLEYCCAIHPVHDETFGENPCFKPISFADLEQRAATKIDMS